MKYRVTIPAPKAKRMIENARLIIVLDNGWEGSEQKEIELEQIGDYEFEVSDKYDWIYSSSISDGYTFDIIVRFDNSTKTRSESYRLVPERIV